jgi:hypothetical protein
VSPLKSSLRVAVRMRVALRARFRQPGRTFHPDSHGVTVMKLVRAWASGLDLPSHHSIPDGAATHTSAPATDCCSSGFGRMCSASSGIDGPPAWRMCDECGVDVTCLAAPFADSAGRCRWSGLLPTRLPQDHTAGVLPPTPNLFIISCFVRRGVDWRLGRVRASIVGRVS